MENRDIDTIRATLPDDLNPVRSAIVLQAASHLGIKEKVIVQDKNENKGPAVDQYATSEPWHVGKGSEWCGLFASWVYNQIEAYAGLSENDFHIGEQNSQQMLALIRKQAPQAIKRWNEYKPQPGDLIIHRRTPSSGHVSVVAHTDSAKGLITSIDGNVQDRVSLVTWQMNPQNPNQIRSLVQNEDRSTGSFRDAFFIDVSELPNFDRLSAAFKSSNSRRFVPTPSADTSFTGPSNIQIQTLAHMFQNAELVPNTPPPPLPPRRPASHLRHLAH